MAGVAGNQNELVNQSDGGDFQINFFILSTFSVKPVSVCKLLSNWLAA